MNNYDVIFNKQDFISVINILGFSLEYQLKLMDILIYKHFSKLIIVEMYVNPLLIRITNDNKLNTTILSYKEAYNFIHELVT